MSLDIEELKVLKLKLFELMEHENINAQLSATQQLVQLAQVPPPQLMDLISVMREWVEEEKKK